MKAQLKKRLIALEKEYQIGETRIKELESELSTLQSTLLRISGAIQVLKEELDKAEQDGPGVTDSTDNEI